MVADGMKKALSYQKGREFRYRKNTKKRERVFDRQKRGKIPEICGFRAEACRIEHPGMEFAGYGWRKKQEWKGQKNRRRHSQTGCSLQ